MAVVSCVSILPLQNRKRHFLLSLLRVPCSALSDERGYDGLHRCDPQPELPGKLPSLSDLLLGGEGGAWV